MEPTPTIGRIVMYTPSEEEKKQMKAAGGNGADTLPAVIVAVWSSTTVNLKVILDGPGDLWKTSVNLGEQETNWNWPPRV